METTCPYQALVNVADVVAKLGADAVKAAPMPQTGETLGALPRMTYSGLWYQVAWGDSIDNFVLGEKVFYRVTVSER